MDTIPKNVDPNLLVGFDHSDDAGIYKLTDEIALVLTADVITPPVNDPFIFGQISAANSISDVYAMGGKPVSCLNLVFFPRDKLEPEILHQIVAGAMSKITEAGAVLAGGHSVEDDEPKFGLSVTGIVHPEKYWANKGAKPGDVLILTKPIGSGVLFNANLKNWVSENALNNCIQVITELNKTAMEIGTGYEIHAATDITGFGLAGHGYEMAKASQVCLNIKIDSIPIMPEALEMYRKGVTTGVNKYTRQLVEKNIRITADFPVWHREIIYDPQTSGGLLFALPEAQGEALRKDLINAGVKDTRLIGRVIECDKDINLVFS